MLNIRFIRTRTNFFVRYKDKQNLNGKIYETPLAGFEEQKNMERIRSAQRQYPHDGIDVQKEFVALELRKNGLTEIELKPISGGKVR